MKYSVILFLCSFAVPARAQIALEHTYGPVGHYGGEFGLVQVDSGEWRYVYSNFRDTISVYNLDHSLDRIIKVPWVIPNPSFGTTLLLIAKNLFDLDGDYAYLLSGTDSNGDGMSIFKEDGSTLFSCEECQLTINANYQGH